LFTKVGCLFRVPTQEYMKNEESSQLFLNTLKEVESLALKKGINLKENLAESRHQYFKKQVLIEKNPMTSSAQRDFLEGKRNEFDDLIEYVVLESRKIGLHLPCYEFIYAALKPLASIYNKKIN
jgi:ketopantoate reductase